MRPVKKVVHKIKYSTTAEKSAGMMYLAPLLSFDANFDMLDILLS